jgi:Cdc6-like AAA superfamily ATPase
MHAHLHPNIRYHLSLYLCGKAGTGKSSLVQNFSPALMDPVERYLDPEILVWFIKQNLIKQNLNNLTMSWSWN